MTVQTPVPGVMRTRALASLRRPVAAPGATMESLVVPSAEAVLSEV